MVLNDWKNKNTGTIPKSEFLKLLQNTLESLNKKMENSIKSDFSDIRIYPFDKQKVLAQPEENENN